MNNLLKKTVFVAFMTSLVAANASAKLERYTLKGDAPSGSKIKSIDAVSSVPFNKRFKKLSLQQQAHVKKQYGIFASDATPPFPQKGLRTIYQPLIAKNKQLDGNETLRLVALVNKNGMVETVTVLSDTDPELNRYAESIFMRTRFDSATCGGERCSMEFPLSLEFQ